ncbi:hypothetical protein HMPREF9630_00238 [Peptoanaerobacter stomatis]|uniref:Uncharacterized protein n=1 Tax=Peptoanaerobacter stomatis TaxID=796937 RepID=V9HVS7_9FIRM|nr:hypothetical protein [Peptoanaerobacter stomatis]EHL18513.1 hypothetical protein HMPREF9630_00238 [Peptoanaerobacter stomatis]
MIKNKEQIQEQEKEEIKGLAEDLSKVRLEEAINKMTGEERQNLLYLVKGMQFARLQSKRA